MNSIKVTTSVEIQGKVVAYQSTNYVSKEKTIVDLGVAVSQHQLVVNADSFVNHYLGKPPAPGVIQVTVDHE